MGHTLVTRFDPEGRKLLQDLMQPCFANKIPFGRDCSREEANAVLDYHLTMLHWAKSQDGYYLNRIQDLKPVPCQIRVTGTQIMYAEECSLLLYFAVEPTGRFLEMAAALEEKTGTPCSRFLHITLAVSKDPGEIEAVRAHIEQAVTFPFTLNIEGLDLYHIWKPTKKVRSL